MEELGECARLGIEAGDIRTFLQIAIDPSVRACGVAWE
jgi:hypothetical protein